MASSSGLLLSVIVLGMLWIWWPVLLGGIAASQQACVDQANAVRNGGFGRRLLISVSRSCSTQWSFAWWTVWLQFFCNVLATIAAVIPAFRENFGFSVSAMFIVEVAILMVGSGSLNSIVVESEDYTNKKNETRSAAQAALAGAVGLMIFDLVYIFCTTSKVEWLYPAIITSSSGSTTAGTAAPAKAASEPYVAPTTVALAETSKPNPDPEVHIEAGSGEAK